jgi:starch-binding outer membrane protein, SusD/RagB family
MKKIIAYLLGITLITSVISCKKNFLDENPQDSLTTANAFKTANDFQASLNNLYRLVRAEFYTVNDNDPMEYMYRTDIAFNVTSPSPNLVGEFSTVSAIVSRHWTALYKIVAEANTIITRAPLSSMSDADKKLFEAKAKFFRAFGYRSLAAIWGGVPLVTEEVQEPKADYVRATRKEVYALCISDLVFAAANLPDINAPVAQLRDGEISSVAANHLLAEVYTTDGQHQKAIDAATAVISNPAMGLMTTRFGTRRTVTPGDVYWDLFRTGNQNRRGAGSNREAIWVVQIETDVNGGEATTATSFASGNGFSLERVHAPLIRDLRVGSPAVAPFSWPASDYSGGRGVGFMAPSKYFQDSVYAGNTTDIRNANHNFVRVFKANNPGVPSTYNTDIDFHNLPSTARGTGNEVLVSGKPSRALYPYQTKCTEPFAHPTNLMQIPASYPNQLKGGAGFTYQDQYLFRLAETYLLRAEAYVGLGNLAAAAADINVVRARSNAPAVLPARVNLDYVLDERIREFGVEEKRLITLMRLGKWYDRIIKCNPIYAPAALTHYNLWPIPQSEIERNNKAILAQNPGY